MNKQRIYKYGGIACVLLTLAACKSINIEERAENRSVPDNFGTVQSDTINSGKINWKDYFADIPLQNLIETALQNNQELNIILQEIEISKNEIRARKGEYLPSVGLKVGGGVDKIARYTNIGAMEATTDIKPGKEMPEPLGDLMIGAYADWEVDIWGRLHNAKKAAVDRYLATVEGQNFMKTNLIAEIAQSYYELLALDNELEIVQQNIQIQNSALDIVKILKQSARTNELAVKRFQAQVLKTTGLQYEIQQKITETENRINFLVGRFPQHVERSHQGFVDLVPQTVYTGIPSDLLANRPDIKQAELELAASKLDIKSAKARFYPSLGITAGIGYQAFNPSYIFKPQSLLYSLAGDLVTPLVNRNAIKAAYYNANAKQIQAVYEYEQTILTAYIEVANNLSKISNLQKSYDLKSQEVDALTQSIGISNDLFKSARADYMEVLLTQREALEAKFELIETKMQQLNATVSVYKALGGGWN
ncbi:efflux transporter, outer membrane factor (OMF) lipoprotein, NodT family [Paenimyroides aquimaris]|uniref:Efflux transporter, outer membrane factor (OMF) lipoprotein, NodT family n=1 Tax=Paenimyroides marinum TaxID=1159016 RepID=A0A1H6L698_9FLAO|nr:efflux transporter outer membrane subunit [Paenimyroides aquimaris]SEH79937.1 efflux transporter, outer membrane factor (OMF) lipoprotein, NodT family [Paenimyroides aquimaris]